MVIDERCDWRPVRGEGVCWVTCLYAAMMSRSTAIVEIVNSEEPPNPPTSILSSVIEKIKAKELATKYLGSCREAADRRVCVCELCLSAAW